VPVVPNSAAESNTSRSARARPITALVPSLVSMNEISEDLMGSTMA
jgi:hypothetical protein